MAAPTLADRLAKYAAELTFDKLTREAVHETKRRFIDSFATAVGAMPSDAYAIAKKCAAARLAATPARRSSAAAQSSVEWATFVNGLLIRYLDFNDTYLIEGAGPPQRQPRRRCWRSARRSAPAARDLITAAVLAYEIQCRFCDAASLRKHGVDHVTYGAISSAVAAGKLMGLDAAKLDPRRRHRRRLQRRPAADASRRTERVEGVRASPTPPATACSPRRWPAEGLTGPAPIFEGDLGFFQLVTREPFDPAPFGGESATPTAS